VETLAEQSGDCRIADIEPARISAEGRQHYALRIGGEGATAHAAAIFGHLGAWMQMAGHFAGLRVEARFMPE